MSDPNEVYCVMNAETHGISVALKLPVRADGALPYLLSEVTLEVKDMFAHAVQTIAQLEVFITDDEDDETTITTEET